MTCNESRDVEESNACEMEGVSVCEREGSRSASCCAVSGFGVWGLVWCFGFRVSGSELMVEVEGCRV